jgi:predicted AAA+ superfamily ATPase
LKYNLDIVQHGGVVFKRFITKELKTLAKQYPVVTVMGPRQAGKTTLVREVFPKKVYVNLESPDIRTFAETDPKGFLAQYPKGAILDEVQRVPQILSYIQVEVDEIKQVGRFILTGSHQLALHEAITQSLAGRTALLTLLPMSISELMKEGIDQSLDQFLIRGALPRIYADNLDPTRAYRNYLQTYVERDVRQIHNVKDLKTFQNFLKLCAGRIGSVLNKESLGNDLGISGNTVHQWLSILEASFIIYQLQPYFENFGKRAIKSPKLYFTDVGLATYLLGIENIEQVQRDPLRGFLVENLVVLELMKARLNQGLDPQLFFYRDNHKNEVDVIFKQSSQLIPIEIKAAQTFSSSFLKGVSFYQNLAGERAKKGFIIYAGEHEQRMGSVEVLNFKNTSTIVT